MPLFEGCKIRKFSGRFTAYWEDIQGNQI